MFEKRRREGSEQRHPNNDGILVGVVGDVLVDRENPEEGFAEIRRLLSSMDVLFANLEAPYSDAPERVITAPIVVVPPAVNLNAILEAGFDVLSMANNHIGDAGHAAMLETRERLRQAGIATCGAGENLTDARRPAIVERDGLKVGFLGYSSVFPHGYQARSDMPGLVPLRAYNHFHEMPEFFAPGKLPRVETIPDPKDYRHLEEDIAALRKEVDILAISVHWGDFDRPFVLTDHEIRTARLCIDRGADLVVGHHHHALRGIEWYRGKPIFYGLGHFVFDLRLRMTAELQVHFARVDPESYAVCPREGWPLLPLHPDTRMTVLGWIRIQNGAIADVGFVPCRLLPDGRVVAISTGSAEGREVLDYVAKCNRSQNLNGVIVAEGAPEFNGHGSVRIFPIDGR